MARRNRISLRLTGRSGDEWDWETDDPEPEQEQPPAARSRASRAATATLFTTLFFAGAAFTAGAGDQLAQVLEDDGAAVSEQAEIDAARQAAEAPAADPAAEAAPAPEEPPAAAPEASAAAPEAAAPAPEAAPAPAAEPAPAAAPEAAPEQAPAAAADAAPETAAAPAPASAGTTSAAAPTRAIQKAARALPAAPAPQPVLKPALKPKAPAPAPEIELDRSDGYGEPTIWLNRALPDPTKPSARLTRTFAKQLFAAAKRHDADWAAILGVLRAEERRGRAPARPAELDALAERLRGAETWRSALSLSGRTEFADRAEALADLYRSIGIETLITGYAKSKDRLAKRLLENEQVLIYSGGRADIEAGRIDVRVLVLLGYLAERHGSITVSSLFAGHRRFSRPGVISAHTYGHAVDVAAVDGTSILGHQQPGGLTEMAVRSVLLLPSELQPQQVISLLGLGGPSFPLRDHGDHIHIGY